MLAFPCPQQERADAQGRPGRCTRQRVAPGKQGGCVVHLVTHNSLAGFRESAGTAVPLEVCEWWFLCFFLNQCECGSSSGLFGLYSHRGFYWQFLNSLETEDFGLAFIWEARCFTWRATSLFLFQDSLLSETP